jgi:adenylate cyclase
VDVRGSTGLAENLSPTEFAGHMNHFFETASEILIKSDAFIDKYVGDEVIALFVPGFAGPEYSRVAVDASAKLLKALSCEGPQGNSFSVGVGVHTGLAFMGAVGTKNGRAEITALGDVMNVAARLASVAGPGEALISEATIEAAELDASVFERRNLRLKGREEGVRVCILR